MAALSRCKQLVRLVQQVHSQARPVACSLVSGTRRGLATAQAQAEEDDVVKQAFLSQQKNFRTMLEELKKDTIPLDPNDDQAVEEFTSRMKNLKHRVGVPTEVEKLDSLMHEAQEDAQDVRSFLREAGRIREQFGIEDNIGAESALLSELDKLEQEVGRPLKLGDAELEQLQDLCAELYQHLPESWDGKSDEEIKEDVELEVTRDLIATMRDAAEAKMDAIKKRDGLEWVQVSYEELGKAPEGL